MCTGLHEHAELSLFLFSYNCESIFWDIFYHCIYTFLCQRAWFLKLLALELHVADMATPTHRDACLMILSHTIGPLSSEMYSGPGSSQSLLVDSQLSVSNTISRSKVRCFLIECHP